MLVSFLDLEIRGQATQIEDGPDKAFVDALSG